MSELRIFALRGVGEVRRGDDLAGLVVDALANQGETLTHHDLVVVTSKVVAKSEGRVVAFDGTDEHKARLIEQESTRILRRRGTLRITETRHGFVNANAGIDLSNADEGTAVLLPLEPDRTARRLRAGFRRRLHVEVAVVITDTFGRAWRHGVTDVAIGAAGLRVVLDLRGTRDANGRVLEATEVALADEIAAAANLVLAKNAATPFAVLRGLDESYFGEGSVSEDIVRSANNDLFR
ncbi:MAG TPA: coenzyme F420-0:L-glutamate ligase [Acidimicrobiales bacterium]|nr:coenzyme F420-0:L-glutamate ligase [Acidimicrobiales bacterium]